ncbi:GDP-L-fucose synthase [Candidatus Gracilibacteria bacterium]|nr:GDP-L-fucose synthase [Candidatus Gracilibacteria bacterium]
MNKNSIIYVAGHTGMVGSAIVRDLQQKGFTNILTQTRKELDLLSQTDVNSFFEKNEPEYVFLAAAKVGGIIGNREYPAQFIYENLMIETNIIHASYKNNVKKLLFLGSSCIYPKLAPQPMTEDVLLTSALEPTNEWYAIAKIAGIKLCQSYRRQYGCNFISVMPTNLYGKHDSYNLQNSHVIPAMLRKFHEAKENKTPTVTIWGTGSPKREFLYADDLANACTFLMEKYDDERHINIGTGIDVSIKELAETIQKVVGYDGEIVFDTTKPDGPPRKLLDVSKLNKLGWKYSIELKDGLTMAYDAFLEENSSGTLRK